MSRNQFPKRNFFHLLTNKLCSSKAIVFALALILTTTGLVSSQATTKTRSAPTNAIARKNATRQTAAVKSHLSDIDFESDARLEKIAARMDALNAEYINAPQARPKKKNKKSFSPQSLTTHVVNNTGDSGPGTLRQAIVDSNGDGMPSNIVFNIPTSDPGFASTTFTISPVTNLPAISGSDTTIDGATQTAFTGNTNPNGPEIVLNGGAMARSASNFALISTAANNAIRNLVINGFLGVFETDPETLEVFFAGGGNAILLSGPNATNNAVTGCYIGTDASGTSAAANEGTAISILGNSNHNQIGGTTAGDKNVISGNGQLGISIQTSGTGQLGNNTIQGNFIGTDVSGTANLGNGFTGILIRGSSNNLVGGTAPGAGNVSSGNGQNGVWFQGRVAVVSGVRVMFEASFNTVQGNKFGTNAAGTAAIANGIDGVRFGTGASHNLIGGTTAAARNICSGNTAHGVHMDSSRSLLNPYVPDSFNTIQGNFIGTDASGIGPIGNQLPGVICFFGAIDNLIGGTGPGEGNVIAYNTGSLVPDGLGGFVPVPGAGVSISFHPTFSDPSLANDPTIRNRISGNSIHSNTGIFPNDGLGIDLNAQGDESDATDGVTANDAGDADIGGNELQNFPVLSSVSSSGGTTTVTGSLNSAANALFSIEFFANDTCDPSGFGEGQYFLGTTGVTTDASGNASFSVVLPVTLGCRVVTATATDAAGNTSEFSHCVNPTPTVACNVATTQMWPPNHDLINVGLSVTASDNCPNPTVSIAVYSDEDDEAPTGDGNFSPDAKNIAPGTLRLRAERNGGADGRVYLIIVSVTDSTGNVARCCKTVTVPKSQSTASKQSVAAQAAAAEVYCQQNGAAPPGFVVVGDGPVVGPKQ